MVFNDAGRMVDQVWAGIPRHYPGIGVDAAQVMPNHIHGSGGLTRPPAGIQFRRNVDDTENPNRSPYVKNLSDYDVNAFHNW